MRRRKGVYGYGGVGAWDMRHGLFSVHLPHYFSPNYVILSWNQKRAERRQKALSENCEHEVKPPWLGSGPDWFLLILVVSASVFVFIIISHYLALLHISFSFCDTMFSEFSNFLALICIFLASFLYF